MIPGLALTVCLLLISFSLIVRYPAIRGPLFAGLLVRLGLLITHHTVFQLIPGRGDAEVFYREAAYFSRDGVLGALAHFDPSHSKSYSAIMGSLMALLGESPLVPELFNIILSMLVLVAAYKVSLNCGASARHARVGIWVLALAPSIAQYGVVGLREIILVLPFMWGLVALTSGRTHMNVMGMLVFVLWCIFAAFFHGAMIVAVAGLGAGLLVFQAFAARQPGQPRPSFVKTAVSLAIFVILMVGVGGLMSSLEINKISTVFDGSLINDINAATSSAARGGTGYLEDYSVDGYGGVAATAPLRAIYFFFSPLPWQISSPVHLLGLLDVVIYMWCFWMLVRGYRARVLTPKMMLVAGVLATVSLAYAFGTSNAGTAIRHRAKFSYGLVAIAAAARSAQQRKEQAQKRLIKNRGYQFSSGRIDIPAS